MWSSIKSFSRYAENYGKKIIAKYRLSTSGTETSSSSDNPSIPSFREFVNYLVDIPVEDFETHMLPIYLHCNPCLFNYTAIARSETLQSGTGCSGNVFFKILLLISSSSPALGWATVGWT